MKTERISRINRLLLFAAMAMLACFFLPARVALASNYLSTATVDGRKVYVYETGKGETLFGIARKNGWDYSILSQYNTDAEGTLRKGFKIYYPYSLPDAADGMPEDAFAVDFPVTTDGTDSLVADSVGDNAGDMRPEAVKILIIMESAESRKDLDYLRGFLTGIDKLKNEDYRISLKALEWNARDNSKADSLMGVVDAFRPDLTFALSDKGIPARIESWGSLNNVPVVNVFDVKGTSYLSNPSVIQLLAPPAMFNDEMARYMAEHYPEHTVVFAGDEDTSDQLAEAIKAEWDAVKVKKGKLNLIAPRYFRPDGKYIIYGCPVKKDEVESLLKGAAAVTAERPEADIVVLGRPNWILYEEQIKPWLEKSNSMIPSRFYIETESSLNMDFQASYSRLFKRQPAKSMPMYAASGYDNALYFIPAFIASKGVVSEMLPSTASLQNEFFLRKTDNGGYVNTPVFLIRYRPLTDPEKTTIF